MYETDACPIPSGKCADLSYRLAVYEAGHALTARALGFSVLSVRMLPRPPTMESDKVLRGNSFRALNEVLENRCIELFGGQIAEQHACATASCCSGDVARIDELTRLIAGLDGKREAEDIWFELEDVALEIFRAPKTRDAIVPLADYLFAEVERGHPLVDGDKVEAKMDELLGTSAPPGKHNMLGRFLARARG